MFHSMKDIAVYLSEISDATGYDYDLLAVLFDQMIKTGTSAEEAVRRIEEAASR